MGLQVRVRHALGERLVDLADRPVERPLLVGRAREADVKIPSVSVGSEHCALFVHNGQWVLQDMSGGATFINGCGTDGPTPLCVGDLIVLGTDASPATIEVDPAGVAQGRSGHPAETHDPVPVARASKTTPRPLAQSQVATDRYASAPTMAAATATAYQPPPPAPAAWSTAPVAQDDSMGGWTPPAASNTPGATPIGSRRRKSSSLMSPGGIIAICVSSVLVLSLFILIIAKLVSLSSTPIEKPKEVAQAQTYKDTSNNMFGIGDGGAVNGGPAPSRVAPSVPVRPKVMPKAAPPSDDTPAPDSTSTTPAPKADPTPAPRTDTPPPPAADAPAGHKDEDGWNNVKAGFAGASIGQAIVKSEDYRRQHITENFKDLDALVEEAMDQLWWNRVASLCMQQSSVMDKMKKNDKDVREETSAAFKKILLDERKPLEAELAEVQKHLNTEMGYTATDPPQLDNKESMKSLRDDRDAGKFGAWKQSTLKYIKSHHGAMPWDG